MKKNLKLATKVIHIGGEPDPATGAVIPPIYQTSTYAQSSPGIHQGYEYSRSHNPTRSRLEENLASLENAKYAVVTSSGVSAISLIMHLLKSKSSILCGNDVYGGTYRLFTTVFNEFHHFTFINTTDLKQVEESLKTKPTAIWIESPTNPLLKISDLKKIAEIAKKYKVLTIVDNTFMSPIFQRPLELGIDIVIHSMTKYLNGHSDVIGGCIMTNKKAVYQKLWTLHNSLGPSQSPFDSWLVLRGIKTLAIRMKAHEENAQKIASFLEKHEKVERVLYPGLKSHPQHTLAKQQMDGFGGMITFFIKGGLVESRKFLERVKLFRLAESLGGVESLIEHPALMTHHSIPKKTRESIGLSDNLIRVSVGIEDAHDLMSDLNQALK